jgi:ATP-dependent DNA helicase PIF1
MYFDKKITVRQQFSFGPFLSSSYSASEFVDLLNSLRMGVASQTAVATFNNLRRPLPAIDGIVPTELFPLRNEVENANKMRLDALKTESQIYESRDTGAATEERRATILKNMVVQRVLEIKVDSQVMLIKNVDENLVNGSIGKVLGFYMVSEVCGSGGEISSKGGNGFIRRVLLGDDGKTPVERKVAERENENNDVKPRSKSSPPESDETFPLVEFRTPLGKEVVLVGRDEFKVEENDGTVAARRVQVECLHCDRVRDHVC